MTTRLSVVIHFGGGACESSPVCHVAATPVISGKRQRPTAGVEAMRSGSVSPPGTCLGYQRGLEGTAARLACVNPPWCGAINLLMSSTHSPEQRRFKARDKTATVRAGPAIP